MKILVTGGSGFIGGHLARRLARLGHTVRVLCRSPQPELEQAGLQTVDGDLVRRETLAEAVEGVHSVFHVAAVRDRWGLAPAAYHAINVEGTLHLLTASIRAGVQRFVHCSTAGVARYPGRIDADESLPYVPASSQVAYHTTKTQAECAVLAATRLKTLPCVVVRPVLTYGPGDETGMMTRLLLRLSRGHFLPVGNGHNHIDLAYVGDVVDGMLRAWEQGEAGQVYILSGPQRLTVREMLALACAALGKPEPNGFYVPVPLARFLARAVEQVWGRVGGSPPITRDAVGTLTVDRDFSHARATADLGYAPRVTLVEGLQHTLDWLKETGRL